MPYPPPLIWLINMTSILFGAILGSFLNVCIYRLPREYLSIVHPPSHCPQCGTGIRWYDNIPVVSWLCLGGACRYCYNPIRFRYVFVEILTAVLFYFCTQWILLSPLTTHSIYVTGNFSMASRWLALLFSFYMVANLIVITFIDIDYRIIPDSLTYPGVLLAIVFSTATPIMHRVTPFIANVHLAGFLSSILGIIVGAGSLYIVGVIGKIAFRKEAMGMGDVKMMAMVGGFLGWDAALLTFLVACIVGTVLGVIWMVITRDHYIPFGPYLAFGTLVILLFKNETIYFMLTVWPRLIAGWLNMPSSYAY